VNDQQRLVYRLFRSLEGAGVLDHVVLIGSWCLLAYKHYFAGVPFEPGIRTRDIDLLVPIPLRLKPPVDIEQILGPLGFILRRGGDRGYMQFVHAELMLEFIVPERGRGSDKPYDLRALGINAQPLRYMDFLCKDVLRLPFGGLDVSVPHPARFALLKLIVSGRRQKPVKRENDLRQAGQVIRALAASGQQEKLREVFATMPKKWQGDVHRALAALPDGEKWRQMILE
jgi:hypothetical protein